MLSSNPGNILSPLENILIPSPFSKSPLLPFAKVFAGDKVYLILHSFQQPWIHLRANLVEQWRSENYGLAVRDIIWILPPTESEEDFFIKHTVPSVMLTEELSNLLCFLSIEWLHSLSFAFLSKDQVLKLRIEHNPLIKKIKLIQNRPFLQIHPSSSDSCVFQTRTSIESCSGKPAIFFIDNAEHYQKLKKQLQDKQDGLLEYIIFFANSNNKNKTLKLSYECNNVTKDLFEQAIFAIIQWRHSQGYPIQDLECFTSWRNYYSTGHDLCLWAQDSAQWICFGDIQVFLPAKKIKEDDVFVSSKDKRNNSSIRQPNNSCCKIL